MDNEVRLDDPLANDIIEAVRALYAPPLGVSYWSMLETRVMDRVSELTLERPTVWWQVVDGWARRGLVAAAAILAVVGALLVHARATEARTTYDTWVATPSAESLAVPAGVLSERDGPDARDATFVDVISQ